jgi:hypothetical protein
MASRELKVEIIGDASSLQKALGNASKGTSRLGSSMKTLGKVAAVGVGAAFAGMAATLKIGFDELAEGQKVSAQTGAVLKSTGRAANVTAKQVEDLASSISEMTGVDDEAVQSGENLLLTFTGIRNEVGKGNDIFNRATLAITDMSVALGQDMKSSAIQLGKALNDPIKGITALRRVGVSFTAAQIEQVKAMVESGDVMGAQKLILAELTKEFGGSAKAAGETLPGQLSKLRNSFDEAAAGVAEVLLPYLTQFLDWVNRNMPTIQATIQGMAQGIAAAIEFIGPIVSTLVDWFRRLSAATQEHWPRIQAVVMGVINWFKTNIVPTVQAVVSAIVALWRRFGDDIVAVLRPAFTIIFTIIDTALRNIKAVIELVMALIRGDWSKAWEALKTIVSNTLSGLKTLITTTLGNLVPALINAAVQLGKAIVEGLVRGLAGLAGAIGGALGKIPGIVRDAAAGAAGAAAGIGRAIVDGILDGLGGLYDRLKSALESALKGVLSSLNPFSPVEEGGVRYIGRPLAEGAVRGWLEGARELERAMNVSLRSMVGGTVGIGGAELPTSALTRYASAATKSFSDVGQAKDELSENYQAFNETTQEVASATVEAFANVNDTMARVRSTSDAVWPAMSSELRKLERDTSGPFNLLSLALDTMATSLDLVRGGLYALRNAARDTITETVGLLNQLGVLSINPPGMASGGAVTAGQSYVVGERGPELFVPRQSGTIVPNTRVGGATTISLNFYGPTVGSSREFQDSVRRALYDVQRRNPGTGLAT